MITPELLKSFSPCKEGYRRFIELFPEGAALDIAISGLCNDGHDGWGKWLFDKCRENNLFQEITSKGYRNTGDRNTGHWNTGYRNTGHMNTGYWNTGDWNTGDRNTGDWNTGDRNTGFFNTVTPDVILVFNKECPMDKWKKAYKPDFLFFDLTYWVEESEMTNEEKTLDPGYHYRGGQLRKKDYKTAFKESWDNADQEDREKIKNLPNFDPQIFFEISGIDLREKD